MAERSLLIKGLATLPCTNKEAKSPDVNDSGIAELSLEGLSNNLKYLLSRIAISDDKNASLSARVRHLNDLAKVIKYMGPAVDTAMAEKIIVGARLALASSVKEVCAGALRVLRYLLTSKQVLDVMLALRVDLLVTRSLDAPPSREIERLQAMRFIRQALAVMPDEFPCTLVAPLVAIVTSDVEPADNLMWSCVGTLSELVLSYPLLAAKTGSIKALLKALLKCQFPRITESIVMVLTYLLNQAETRKYISAQMDIESILAPITDPYYKSLVDDAEKKDQDNNVESAKLAVSAMLKTWPGLLCFCGSRNNAMKSLLSVLPANSSVQKEILEILYNAFQLKVPVWTDCYNTALISVDPSQPQAAWSLQEGWVAQEAKALLPPKSSGRSNLIQCYQALMLTALMDVKLFEQLAKVVREADQHVTVRCAILLGELLHFANTMLPPRYSSGSHCLPELISSAVSFETHKEHNRASEVISCLDRVHQLKKQDIKASSLYLKLILEQAGYRSSSARAGDQSLWQHMPIELDETAVGNIIRDTNVLSTKEYVKWDWKLILSLLQHPFFRKPVLVEDATFDKFLKRLCNFYKPSNHLYSSISYSEENSCRYSHVGQELVKYFCQVEGTSGYLGELITVIVNELGQVTVSKLTADVFSTSSINNKLARDYFLLLGTISFYNSSLLSQYNAYGYLFDICNYHYRIDLIKLMIASLDFAHDHYARAILSKILTSGSKEMRLYATQHLRVHLRAKMPVFNSWGMELLIAQLYDLDKEVAMEAIDILDEACDQESFLEALVLQHPALLHLGERGVSLFTRFIAVKRGFARISALGYLEPLLKKWFEEYNQCYVYLVEEKLAEALTSYRQMEAGEFNRVSDSSVISPKAFVPIHFYGQLVQHEEGCALLKQVNHVQSFATAIGKDQPRSPSEILDLKAAIWALGHVGSSSLGLELLLEHDIINCLVEQAEESPVLSIRGTAFYALCLICKTQEGANALLKEGWVTVRHSSEVKWPLVFEQSPLECADYGDGSGVTSPLSSPFKVLGNNPKQSRVFRGTVGSSPLHSSGNHGTFVVGASREGLSLLESMDHRDTRLMGEMTFNASNVHKEERRTKAYSIGLNSDNAALKSHQHHSLRDHLWQQSISHSPAHSSELGHVHLQRATSSNLTSGGNSYVAVCLPLDLEAMFEYPEAPFKGSLPQYISTPYLDQFPHFPNHCMECMYLCPRPRLQSLPESSTAHIMSRENIHIKVTDENGDITSQSVAPQSQTGDSQGVMLHSSVGAECGSVGEGEGGGGDETMPSLVSSEGAEDNNKLTSPQENLEPKSSSTENSTEETDSQEDASVSSSTTQSISVEDQCAEEKRRLHGMVLDIIFSLSSDISLRRNLNALNTIWQKFTTLGQDVCLYCKVVDLLSLYSYRLSTRRFIQGKFEGLKFEVLFTAHASDEGEDDVISLGSSRASSIGSEEMLSSESDARYRRLQRGSGSGLLFPRQLKLMPHQKGDAKLLVPTGSGDAVPTSPDVAPAVQVSNTAGKDAQGAKLPPPAANNEAANGKDLNAVAEKPPPVQLVVSSVINATYEL